MTEAPSDSQSMEVAARRGSVGELAVVFGLTVALPIGLLVLSGRIVSFDFSQARLLRSLGAELVMVALLWPWLAARGWSFRAIAGAPEPKDILRALGVVLLCLVANIASTVAWMVFVPGTIKALAAAAAPTGTAAWWVVLAMSIINPIVEEFLWLGYGVSALTRYGLRTAVAISVACRVAVHMYQGIVALIAVLPIAVVFTLYYVGTKRLWPIIVAHMMFDALALQRLIVR